jgi:hypothetical protein
MDFSSWLRSVRSQLGTETGHRLPKRTASTRLSIEPLEDRSVPSFSPITSYAVGTNPQAVVSTDFNGDGNLDLALATSDHSPSVRLGNGDGTFDASEYTFGGVRSVAAGDFNSDGRPDLVALFGDRDGVAVVLGNGDGTFQTAQIAYVGMTPTSVAVGDLNSDGKLDLVTTSYSAWGYYDPETGYSYGGNAGYANVLLSNGDGTFASYFGTYLLNDSISGSSSALGDFNGDGKLDFAADGSVLIGNGDGTFGTPRPAPIWNVAATADVNADGKLDLVGDGVALGNGDGTFQTARYYEAAGPSVRVADFDGDGRRDLTSQTNGGFLVVQLGNGDGTFRDAYHFVTGSGYSLTVGDFNDDQRLDVVTANADAGTVTVLLNDGDWTAPPDPTLSISYVTVAEGNTSTTAATFTLTLSAAADQEVTVRYATADGYAWSPATADSDYVAGSGQVTIPAGRTTATVVVPVFGDRVAENTEYFSVNLSDPVNAFITRGQGVGTIMDDEPTLSIEPYASVSEGNVGTTPLTFTVTLSAPYDAPVSVDYTTADLDYSDAATAGLDYTAASGTLTFATGETSKSITVLVNGDTVVEPQEYFYVSLTNPTSAFISGDSYAYGSIVDDEPYVSIGDGGTVIEGHSGTKSMTFTLTLSTAAQTPVAVTYATSNNTATAGSDYQTATGTVTFAPGETSKSITVLVKGDRVGEAVEYFYVSLNGATGANVGNSFGLGTIQDDEPRISISDVSKAEGKNRTTTLFTFTVTLSAPYDQAVTMSYRTVNGTATSGDYVSKTGTVTFAPGETSKTITIEVTGDNKREADEYFYLDLFGNSSNSWFNKNRGLGTILNDD